MRPRTSHAAAGDGPSCLRTAGAEVFGMYLVGCKVQDISRVGRRFALEDELKACALTGRQSIASFRIISILCEPETQLPRTSCNGFFRPDRQMVTLACVGDRDHVVAPL